MSIMDGWMEQLKQKPFQKTLSEDSEPSSGDIDKKYHRGASEPSSRDRKKRDKKPIKTKKGSLSVGKGAEPTKAEKEIMVMISEKFMTPKKIAVSRKCTKRYIYKIIKILKKKGLINSIGQTTISEGRVNHPEKNNHNAGNKKVHNKVKNKDGTCEPSYKNKRKKGNREIVNQEQEIVNHPIRLHGQQFNVRIIQKDEKYIDTIGKTITVDGNTVRCHKEVIDVYSWQSFIGADPHEATRKSLEYWSQFFIRLENDLKIILVKPRAQNIRQVKAHYSEVDNELSVDADHKDYKIKVFTTDDKKLWFTIDNSFNFHEAETMHPQDAEKDMQDVVQPFFNDLRDNKPPTLSKLMQVMGNLLDTIKKEAEVNSDTAAGLNTIVKMIEYQQQTPHVKHKDKKDDQDLLIGYG